MYLFAFGQCISTKALFTVSTYGQLYLGSV